jgi:hypothetical protein
VEEWDSVTGESYRRAVNAMAVARELFEQREHKGFASKEEAYKFADSMHCTLRVYSTMHKGYFYITHNGELLSKTAWFDKYASILYYTYETEEGKVKKVTVTPERFADTEDARCISEKSDGRFEPLMYRDYYLPKGYYNEEKGLFNIAIPITSFARQTGADTSYIYTFLQHLCGVNYKYVLAWLREKMMNPMHKTEVVPVFVSKTQGTGKSTFGNVICQGMFGRENVIVSDQYDSSARFNADYADALIVCLEEKKQDDKRNDASSMKSRITAEQIRKELKGVDPIYQESYTDFIITTNGEVPIKFDSIEQRRFMVIEVDDTFTRANEVADEVFTKLYGFDANRNKKEKGFRDDKDAIEQFKWELLNNKEIAETNPRDFIKTDAYTRCFAMPRTNEAVEIEALLKALAPFIQQSLLKRKRVEDVIIDGEEGQMAISLSDIVTSPEGTMFLHAKSGEPPRYIINRMVIFVDQFSQKPFAHSTVERALMDAKKWLRKEYGIILLSKAEPPSGGFKTVSSRYKMSPSAWFVHETDMVDETPVDAIPITPLGISTSGNVVVMPERIGRRMRYSEKTMLPDPNGVLETVNELKVGSANRGKQNAQYIDTFLLEADETTATNKAQEEAMLKTGILEVRATDLYMQRLRIQLVEAERLYKERIVARVVYSGTKSLHMLVRVDPSPRDLDERRWLFAYLCKTLSAKLTFDNQVGDPTRLTRAPVSAERIVYSDNGVKIVGTQELLMENWDHVYKIDWLPMYKAWLEQPKDMYESKGKSMLPTKEIYREAAHAFMEGTYFTDKRWNGHRQETFFSMYRIVRALGYTYEQVWDEVIQQTKDYYRKEDIAYWVSRQNSDIVREIEGDL